MIAYERGDRFLNPPCRHFPDSIDYLFVLARKNDIIFYSKSSNINSYFTEGGYSFGKEIMMLYFTTNQTI
jgi:hypothetical protein